MPGFGLGVGAEELGGEERREGRKKRSEQRHLRAGGRRRAVASPDSLISHSSDHHSAGNGNASVRSAGSQFSSASGSAAYRRSFGSDHDPPFSQLSVLHLAGRERSGGAGLDPDPEKGPSLLLSSPDILTTPLHKGDQGKLLSFSGFTELEKDSVQSEEEEEEEEQKEEEEEEEEEESLDPAQHSFSHARRECKGRRFRSEAAPLPGRKPRRRRPASLDLSNSQGADAAVLSPRLFIGGLGGGMKKSSASSSRSRSGTFPSPGTPNYRQGVGAAGYQKGWSSERVAPPVDSSRRYGGNGVLLPFNNGRTLPSKWEDAEKWIFSPVSGDGIGRPSVPPPHHRRPKSKSGPLGAPGNVHRVCSSASPPVPCFDGERVGNFAASSPFLAGVLIPERGCCGGGNDGRGRGGGGGKSYSANTEPYIVRSASTQGWVDTLIESSSSLPSSHGTTTQDVKLESARVAATMVSPLFLRKDVATQMSPEGSSSTSPKKRHFISPSAQSAHPIQELESHLSKLEVRDVQVDDRVTVTRWSKKHIARGSDRRLTNIIEWKKKTVGAKASSWEVADSAKSMSKCKREEAKITAWENLQKAKAEAAIRKLEVKRSAVKFDRTGIGDDQKPQVAFCIIYQFFSFLFYDHLVYSKAIFLSSCYLVLINWSYAGRLQIITL
ncbi:uncharacterized protein LOC103712515 isoform X2 [Phoenix dactylifera]|uniref:Uncharacterized protein LOC103712515 isoform X2 n=1 Tax=Phoenix dactylifera TaxID=42345 RepID=A0A8B9ATG8_PHODC|nr:uncharacterized protein LOC103712515 isoform X2 [Phoenix dactylifera]